MKKRDVETTGHEWDGIEELNNPLPRWWLWVFYATIVWGIGYTIAYPAWPGIRSATAGVMGWSTRANIAEDIAAATAANAEITARLAETPLTEIAADPVLDGFARNSGGAVFRTWCAQCHGSGAAGAKGYPNLLDDEWLWGGSIEAIHESIQHGIRNDQSDMARYSEMPAFGEILEDDEIDQVVNYVMSLSGEPREADLVAAGGDVFADNCSACHGAAGEGDQSLGAPNLSNAVWLYGGDYETIRHTVEYSRYGVMPAWQDRLSDAEIAAVATYVHGLGGGE
ncbi:cytochrome c oxidase cbb3-type subunit 3 [Poseidonocella pacifica]|uniref:Cbb3-type cytochrome c oxidase subunit n=1 Tax=Poseidonocella pacifica TaxID=871651 RepID=A0A1I0XIK6_9RHOB|nr:cytochrome-c oxidase, cbb3-type subunit III [Poseidonocella pacifica]SFB00734.1 cytochrome c oxidase cbb3-type subunit 3 [Poseidonocella pacifica]